MTIQVPAAAYAAYARGDISREDIESLEKMAEDLTKTAGLNAGSVAALGGLAVAAPTLAYAGAKFHGVSKEV